MASISKDPSGNRTIQFVGADGKRRSIRLGKVNAKQAESLKLKVETLAASVAAKLPLDSETAAWLGNIGDDLSAKLAGVGLTPARQSTRLGDFLSAYLKRREADAKPATITHMGTVRNDLVRFFGEAIELRSITEQKADDFRIHYLTRLPKLAAATVAHRLKDVRLFFEHARKMKLITENPFRDISATSVLPEERRHYISVADTEKLLAASNPTWRTIIALARYAGMRCPSEVLSLKWEHVNFETNRMTIPSPKTEHRPGKAYRVAPIFALLRTHLEDAFELAEEGEVFVVGGTQGETYRAASHGKNGWVGCNIRTTFEKIVRRAGLKQWPRLFHNLRASCETDLVHEHPIHAVCSWIGNTPAIANRHYLQVLDSDFRKAAQGGANSGAVVVQNAVQTGSPVNGQKATHRAGTLENLASCPVTVSAARLCTVVQMGPAGLEPATNPL